ncbi:MAG: ABC transporter ATP-binding protein [Phycisphaerales bacterium]|jgi:peptide/nickel transport system ATP-binding protein|nr:ABC transporter ATP-binding protein [Phycisphaerales bacterium]
MDNKSPILEIRDLQITFPPKNNPVFALRGVSLSLEKGKTLGVVGESGSGKSTLARAVMKLTEPTAGSILFDGRDVSRQFDKKRIQMVFQDPGGSLNPYANVASIITEPLLVHKIAKGKELYKRAEFLLEQVGLCANDGSLYPHEFSGGQKQRIAIARAISLKPDLLVCDEPTSALDVSVQATVLNLLSDLRDELNLTILFISHDIAVVHHFCDGVIVMDDGKIIERGPVEEVVRSPSHPSTKKLIASSQPWVRKRSDSPSCML